MLTRVAAVLDIDAGVLTDSSAAQRAADCVDTVEVRAIKAALSRYTIFHTRTPTGMADWICPELADREHELLSLFGMLFLAASITVAAQDDTALALAQAEHVAPEEVPATPPAHGLLRSLLDTTSGESSRILRPDGGESRRHGEFTPRPLRADGRLLDA